MCNISLTTFLTTLNIFDISFNTALFVCISRRPEVQVNKATLKTPNRLDKMYHCVRLPLITHKMVEHLGYCADQSARLIWRDKKWSSSLLSKKESIYLTRSLAPRSSIQYRERETYLFSALLLPCSMRVALQFLNNVCFTEIAAPITRADQITLALTPQGFCAHAAE